jgi:glycosyltransferase involved in cell wall biosynthesis
MVLGTGREEARLLELAKDHGVAEHVIVEGHPRAELPALLRRAGVVAMLSDYESQGMAAHEALALGARLVVTDATALSELRGRPEVVAIPRDAPAHLIADAVVRQLLAGDPDREAPKLPSWDECAASLASLYAEIVYPGRRSARTG